MFRKHRAPLNWPSALLQVTLLLVSAMALATTNWADHLTLIPLVVIMGGLAGTLIGHSRVGSKLGSLMVMAYGLFVIGWLYGWTLDPTYTMHEKSLVLLGRMRIFLSVVSRGLANQDPLPVVMILALAYWIFATVGSQRLVRRRDILAAVAPAGAALIVVVHFYVGPSHLQWMLGLYVACSLLLALDNDLISRETNWRGRGARITPHAVGPVLRAGAVVLLAIVLLSWAGPAFARSDRAADAWERISSPFTSIRERVGDALSGFRSAATIVSDEFGSSLTLEAGTEPGDDLIMEVAPSGQLRGSGRFYWRARVHDTYSGGKWTDTDRNQLDYNPRVDPELGGNAPSRERIEISFAPISSIQHILYLPSQPVSVNRIAEYTTVPGSGSPGDITALYAQQPVFPGEVYRAEADISVATADELRSAGVDYPEWVIDRYLQVPEEVTDRTLELAELIAGDQPTAYDKAAAVTTWLRRNIEYQRVTPAPPPDREPIDWFLFDYQTGFCNYYASAEVIMLRSLGVPARLAVGYARGSYQPNQLLYQVHAADFHAWPEVYFPGSGWVEFEPTVSQPPLVRPGRSTQDEEDGSGLAGGLGGGNPGDEIDQNRLEELLAEEPLPEQTSSAPAGLSKTIVIGLLLAATIGAGVLVLARFDPIWLLPLASLGDSLREALTLPSASGESASHRRLTIVERAYKTWMSWWPRLGLRASADQTPRERARVFSQSVPDGQSGTETLTTLYEEERFGGRPAGRDRVLQVWADLRPALWRALTRRMASRLASAVQAQPDSTKEISRT